MPDFSESRQVMSGSLGNALAPQWTRSLAAEMKRRGIWSEDDAPMRAEDERLALMRKARQQNEMAEQVAKSSDGGARTSRRPAQAAPEQSAGIGGALAGRIIREARVAAARGGARVDVGGGGLDIEYTPAVVARPMDQQAWAGQRGLMPDPRATGFGDVFAAKAHMAVPVQKEVPRRAGPLYGMHGGGDGDPSGARVAQAAPAGDGGIMANLESSLNGVLAAAGIGKSATQPVAYAQPEPSRRPGPTISAHPSGGHVVEFLGDRDEAGTLWRSYNGAMQSLGYGYVCGETFRHADGGMTQVVVYNGQDGPAMMAVSVPGTPGAQARIHVRGPELRPLVGG